MLGSDRPLLKFLPAAKGHAAAAPKGHLSQAELREAVRRFVAKVGGRANAQRAIEMLALLERGSL